MKKRIAALALAGIALAACDPAWEDMTPGHGPSCTHNTTIGYHDGDFTGGQVADINSSVAELQNWSAAPFFWIGPVSYRWDAGMPDHAIVFEKRPVMHGGFPSPGMGLASWGADGTYIRGMVWLDPSNDTLPSPAAQAYDSGRTFRSETAHELLHAAMGLGDMYDNPEGGHPGLLMGNGMNSFNQYALGDIIGTISKGCRTPEAKTELINRLLAQYG